MPEYICTICRKKSESAEVMTECPICHSPGYNLRLLDLPPIPEAENNPLSELRLLSGFGAIYTEKLNRIQKDFADFKQQKEQELADEKTQLEDAFNTAKENEKKALFSRHQQNNNVYKKALMVIDRDMMAARDRAEAISQQAEKDIKEAESKANEMQALLNKHYDEIKKALNYVSSRAYQRAKKSKKFANTLPDPSSLGDLMHMGPRLFKEQLITFKMQLTERDVSLFKKYLSNQTTADLVRKIMVMEREAPILYKSWEDQIAQAKKQETDRAEKTKKDAKDYFNGPFQQKHNARVNEQEQIKKQADKKAEDLYTSNVQAATKKRNTRIQAAENRIKNEIMNEYAAYGQKMLNLRTELINVLQQQVPPEALKDKIRRMAESSKALRERYIPATSEPESVVVGQVRSNIAQLHPTVKKALWDLYAFCLDNEMLQVPLVLGLDQGTRLMFKYDPKQSGNTASHMQNICLNTFLTLPPNRLHFYLIDPVQTGQTFAMLRNFEDPREGFSVIQGEIQTAQKEIEDMLRGIETQISSTVSSFKGQSNIRKYNATNPRFPQNYYIVAIMDFPNDFSANALSTLRKIVSTGSSFGFFPLIMADETRLNAMKKDPHLEPILSDIENMTTVFKLDGDCYRIIRNNVPGQLEYAVDQPMSVEQVSRIAGSVRNEIKKAGNVNIDYRDIMPSENDRFHTSNDEGIVVPIGMDAASEIQYFSIGKVHYHAGIVGKSGRGKSRLLHSIITGCLLRYPKEELELYLIDFKRGNEFGIYSDYNIPNIKIVAMNVTAESGFNVLKHVEGIVERRHSLINGNNKTVDIVSYNRMAAQEGWERWPRILLVIDECHQMFADIHTSDEMKKEAGRILDKMLRQDRNSGVNVILCSQGMSDLSSYVDHIALSQVDTRVAFPVDPSEADFIFGGDGKKIMSKISENETFTAIYCPSIAVPEKNYKFKSAHLTAEEHPDILKIVGDHYSSLGQDPIEPIVLSPIISETRRNVYMDFFRHGTLPQKTGPVHMGASMTLEKDFSVNFARSDSNNLLLAGSDANRAQSILLFMLLDIALQKICAHKAGKAEDKLFIIKYNLGDMEREDDLIFKFGTVLMDLTDGIGRYEDAVSVLDEVYALYLERMNGQNQEGRVWFFISGLNAAENLMYLGPTRNSGYSKFMEILSEGPKYGIHVVAWTSLLTKITNMFRGSGDFYDIVGYFKKHMSVGLQKDELSSFVNRGGDDSDEKKACYYEPGEANKMFQVFDLVSQSSETNLWLDEMLDKINNAYNS